MTLVDALDSLVVRLQISLTKQYVTVEAMLEGIPESV